MQTYVIQCHRVTTNFYVIMLTLLQGHVTVSRAVQMESAPVTLVILGGTVAAVLMATTIMEWNANVCTIICVKK